jgi:transmembrane sensor
VVREVLTIERLDVLGPREAAACFVMRRADGLTSSEEQLLSGWLARDETHRRMFDSADRAWQAFAKAEGNEILAAMRAQARAARPRVWASWNAVAAAAVLLLAVGAALFSMPSLNPWAPAASSAAPIEYVAAQGAVKEIQLPDGSRMTLDVGSLAVARFDAAGRNIELQRGRAFFEVTPDRSRPFAVSAAGRTVVAVGTRFDVDLPAQGMTVTLIEGHVTVARAGSAGAPVMLEPGEQYVERHDEVTIRTLGAASENVVAWRVGLLSFTDQPLAEAAAVMNRYSHEQIVVNDPRVASIRVSGQFRAGEAQRFAATLAELHHLRSIHRADQIELLPAE